MARTQHTTKKTSSLSIFWSRILLLNRILVHPIFVFVVLQLVSIAITVLWVIWYVNQTEVSFDEHTDLAFLIAGCILLGIVILGTAMLFFFAVNQSRLNKQQHSFVSSVTHELRSPIASMQLSMETLLQRHLDSDIRNKIHGMILTDLDRLVNLVDQILVSARLDRGIKMFETVESLNVPGVINDAVERAKHLDNSVAERINVECPTDLELVAARQAINLIMSNLVENAVKYSPRGSKINITAYAKGQNLILRVKDRGFGLDQRERKRIFKIFNRGDVAAKRAIPGTGLGLYIVRSIVKVMEGRVWVESPGRNLGSSFFVSIPQQAERAGVAK